MIVSYVVCLVRFVVLQACDIFFFFFFNDPAPTEIYTLSLHDALPIFGGKRRRASSAEISSSGRPKVFAQPACRASSSIRSDRKSTRLNSSHVRISYAVFCLKKKKHKIKNAHYYHKQKRLNSHSANCKK